MESGNATTSVRTAWKVYPFVENYFDRNSVTNKFYFKERRRKRERQREKERVCEKERGVEHEIRGETKHATGYNNENVERILKGLASFSTVLRHSPCSMSRYWEDVLCRLFTFYYLSLFMCNGVPCTQRRRIYNIRVYVIRKCFSATGV